MLNYYRSDFRPARSRAAGIRRVAIAGYQSIDSQFALPLYQPHGSIEPHRTAFG